MLIKDISLTEMEVLFLKGPAVDLCEIRGERPYDMVRQSVHVYNPYDMVIEHDRWRNVAHEIAVFVANEKYKSQINDVVTKHNLWAEL